LQNLQVYYPALSIKNNTLAKLAMPGGGLYILVAYGAQNVLLSGNPDFTFFYKTYKKYTHFSEESVTLAMDGIQELSIDQPIQVRLKIQRIADLVSDMYLIVDLPDIYCKWLDLNDPTIGRTSQLNFNWTRYIGCQLIQQIGFYIGGQKIQEFDGTYMIAKAQADLSFDQFQKWRRLVGDVPELYDPAAGIYSGGSANAGYPLVYPDLSGGNVNRPSIFGRSLQIPLPFWFTEATFGALPLLSLQYQECEVQIIFRPINQLYQLLDANGNTVAPGFVQIAPPANEPTNPSYVQSNSPFDNIGLFLTDWTVQPPLIPTWALNPRIQSTYIYLTDEERQKFASTPLQYLVRQVTIYTFNGLLNRQLAELRTHNPINRLFIVPSRSDSLTFRNDVANWSNWLSPTKPPYIAPATQYPSYIVMAQATGQLVQVAGQQSILQTLRLLGDGNELQEEKPIQYYTDTVAWKYLEGQPDPNLVVYPFGLHSPGTQPDGSLNSSRVRLLQLDLNPYPLLADTNYTYNFTVYVENLNWVNVSSGLGGLKYAL
jgi:Major capsid protein N-terminus/Large eukaryotic DNA virus major capsid protein